jgi:hypothetical protein
MRSFKVALGILVAALPLLGTAPLRAETTSGAFGVTIVLRTFSEAVTADHRCTHHGQAEGHKGTLRIFCPASVDVQAIATASSSKTGQVQRMNAAPDHPRLGVVSGTPMMSAEPIELTISW